MIRLLLFGLLVSMDAQFSIAYASDLPSSVINAGALNQKRLFFAETQRRVGTERASVPLSAHVVTKSVLADSKKADQASREIRDSTLHYTGVIRSTRGLQVLLNGLPWRSGDFDVVSARLQLGSDLLEVTLLSGKRYRLKPGETIELGL